MPGHNEHHAFCKAVLGYTCPEVDSWLDEPFEQLKSQHRILRHSILEIGLKYNPVTDNKRFKCALLHIFLDDKLTAREAYLLFQIMGLKK